MRSIWRWSLMGVAVIAMSQPASADFEVTVEQDLSLENAGILYEGYEGSQAGYESTVIDGNAIEEPSSEWMVSFLKRTFPANVPEERGAYVLWRIEPDTTPEDGPGEDYLRVGDNFEIVHSPIPAGISTANVSFSELPPFGTSEAVAGDYSFSVVEFPETKWVYDPETDTSTEEPYTDEDFMEWLRWTYGVDFDYFEGEVPETYSPIKERTFSFTYNATAEPACCSSILFIPGIKATELYEGDDRRWLPGLFNLDASRLHMSQEGTSLNSISVGDPINEAYSLVEIYSTFFEFLNELKANDSLSDWQKAPYDWRYDVFDVVSQDQHMRDGSTQNLVTQIQELAATSDTGKVTIIAHSNGGLVGKALIDALGNDSSLVDRFIMVGTPQLGTPSSISAMLHGYDQGLPINSIPFTMSKSVSRVLSENMPGAYGLLPVGMYQSLIATSTIQFDDSSYTQTYRHRYGQGIDSKEELIDFLLGREGRLKPSSNDTLAPTILNEQMLDTSITNRERLETWIPPAEIEVIEIAGWGLDTLRGIKYRARECSLFAGCTTFLDIEPLLTSEGDQTVVSPSAGAIGDEIYYFDMRSFNESEDTSWSHANMLAASSVQDLLSDIIKGEEREATYISTTKPEAEGDKRLLLSVHSPVTIGIRDSEGRFTGVIPNPDASSDIPVVIQEIPNTYYFEFGGGKYVGFQEGDEYEVVMEGTGSGTFTLEIKELDGDSVTSEKSFTNVPVEPYTSATLQVENIENVPSMEIDTNGDGVIDTAVFPDGVIYEPVEEDLTNSNSGGSKSVQARSLKGDEKVAVQVLNARLVAMAMQDMRSLLVALKERLAAGAFDAISSERLIRVLGAMEIFIKFLQQLRGTI